MGKRHIAKCMSVFVSIAVILICFTMPASAYTLSSDFTQYTLLGVDNAPVNKPLPVETKDGIQIANTASIFENKNSGITLKNKVKVDGLEIVYRLDSWDGAANDYPAFCIGLSEEPGMLTWNCQMDGACKSGFMLQHRPVMSKDVDSYYSFATFDVGMGKIKEPAGGSGNISKLGQTVILKFKYDSAKGLIITANGVQLTRGEEQSTDFKDLRAVADQFGGQMYLGFTSHCQAIFGETIKATVMFINGQKVSSKQTNTLPTLPPADKTTTSAATTTTTGGKTTTAATGGKTTGTPGTTGTNGETDPDVSETEPEETEPDDTGDVTADESTPETAGRSTAAGGATTTGPLGTGGDDNTDNTVLIIVLVAVAVVVAGGGAGAFFLLRRKSPAGPEPPPSDGGE